MFNRQLYKNQLREFYSLLNKKNQNIKLIDD